MPVKAKSSMPIRQIAELIQCHSCNFFSQYARCELPETADFMENLGWTCAAMEGVRHSAIGWKHSRSDDAQMRITFIYFTKAKRFPWSRRVPSSEGGPWLWRAALALIDAVFGAIAPRLWHSLRTV